MCCVVECVGSYLYVVVDDDMCDFLIFSYSLDQDFWEELLGCLCYVDNLCVIGNYMYVIGKYN